MAHLGGVLIVKALTDYSFARAKVIQMVRDYSKSVKLFSYLYLNRDLKHLI